MINAIPLYGQLIQSMETLFVLSTVLELDVEVVIVMKDRNAVNNFVVRERDKKEAFVYFSEEHFR